MEIELVCNGLRAASQKLESHTAAQKNAALRCVAQSILKNKDSILKANAVDVKNARESNMSEALVERLSLDEKKFKSILDSIDILISQNDPIGEETAGWVTPGGLEIRQVRVPLGVVGIIYESRPNVTVDAFCLAYKSGNSILLRGSSNALASNNALTEAIKEGLRDAGNDGVEDAIYLCQSTDHSDVDQILGAVGYIDVVLPRGSANLINRVVQNAKVPVIQTGAGVCHLFVDESAKIDSAVKIAFNAKTQRPGACNAIETILVHEKIAQVFLEKMAEFFGDKVEFRADEKSYKVLKGKCKVVEAKDSDFGFEFLDQICAVKVVSDVNEAISYINTHNTKHSESIVTECRENARLFQKKIDAACVYVNASTRFTDGGEFGFGAELGISTQKLHARGPMGIKALTTTKFLIDGDGQIR